MHVSVTPRRRVRSQADVVRLVVGLGLVGVGVLVATWLRHTVGGAEEDLVVVYERVPDRFAEVLAGLALVGAGVVPVVALGVLLVRRRYRLAAALLCGAVGAGGATRWLIDHLAYEGVIAVDPVSDRAVELPAPAFATSPLGAAAVALVTVASPWLSQQWRRVLWAGVGLLGVFLVVSLTEPLLDTVIAAAVGMAAGSLALIVFATDSSDPDADELVGMLRPVGQPTRVEQHPGAGPLVYTVEVVGAPPMEMRVRTAHDRSEKLLEELWRSVRLRTWVTGRPYDTVQRRIEHEALAQRVAADAGARVPAVRRIVSSVHGSVGLLEDRVEGTAAADLATFDRALALDVWRQVERLHAGRIAHRNLDVSAVLVTPDGRAVLRHFDGAAVAARDRDLALDRAQLLVSTALVMGASAAVDVAVEALGAQEVVSAVPYLQPLALTARTRRGLRDQRDVLDELRTSIGDATGTEPAPLARLDRLRPRTAMSIATVAVAFYVLLPQLGDVGQTVDAARDATWWWLVPMVAGTAATIVFGALAFVASVPEPIPYLPALRMQIASSFVSRLTPANTGSVAIGLRFLQRSGIAPGPAAAAVGLVALAGFVVHLSLTGAFVVWAGSSGLGFSLPAADVWFIAITAVVTALGLVGLVPALRRRVLPPLVEQARNAATSLADVLTDPPRVIGLVGGSVGITTSYILTLVASVTAFGGGVTFPEIGAAYLVGVALGSAAPTPGGLGAIEGALVYTLTGYGMSTGPALSAVLTYRLVTLWLPMLPGWLMFHHMQRRDAL